MARKTKRTYQKQKQQQVQKVVVNVGEVKKRKRGRKKRARREPSQEAQEYAQSISQIIPKIQYSFPSHTNFGYEPPANIMQQTRPNDVTHSIPIMAYRTLNERENLLQETDRGFPKSQFTEPKPEPDALQIKKPEPSAPYKERAIYHEDHLPSLAQGFEDFAKAERKKLVIGEEIRRVNKPTDAVVQQELMLRGLPFTEENKQIVSDEIISKKMSGISAPQLRKERTKKEAKQIKELVERGIASVPRQRPKSVEPIVPIMEAEMKPAVPILKQTKITTLADLEARAKEAAKSEKAEATEGKIVTIKVKKGAK